MRINAAKFVSIKGGGTHPGGFCLWKCTFLAFILYLFQSDHFRPIGPKEFVNFGLEFQRNAHQQIGFLFFVKP